MYVKLQFWNNSRGTIILNIVPNLVRSPTGFFNKSAERFKFARVHVNIDVCIQFYTWFVHTVHVALSNRCISWKVSVSVNIFSLNIVRVTR